MGQMGLWVEMGKELTLFLGNKISVLVLLMVMIEGTAIFSSYCQKCKTEIRKLEKKYEMEKQNLQLKNTLEIEGEEQNEIV